jgi:nucleoporin POM152
VQSGGSYSQAKENALVRNVNLQKTQSIYGFSVSTPGIVRIERIIDKSDNDVRIPHESSENAKMIVVPCPSASFTKGGKSAALSPVKSFCAGEDATRLAQQDEAFKVDVFGFPPLRLSYHKLAGSSGKREAFSVESIAPEGAVVASHSPLDTRSGRKGTQASRHQQVVLAPSEESGSGNPMVPQIISVPLNITLNTPGSHLYRLDKVTDACGNSLDFSSLRERYSTSASQDAASTGETTVKGSLAGKLAHRGKQNVAALLEQASSQKMVVYPRSQVAFVGCGTGSVSGNGAGGAGQPIKLLRGKKASLQLVVRTEGQQQNQALDDGPWEAKVRFEPEAAEPGSSTGGWEKTVKLAGKNERLEIDAPGTYSIVGLTGSHCSGEVLEPSEVRSAEP